LCEVFIGPNDPTKKHPIDSEFEKELDQRIETLMDSNE